MRTDRNGGMPPSVTGDDSDDIKMAGTPSGVGASAADVARGYLDEGLPDDVPSKTITFGSPILMGRRGERQTFPNFERQGHNPHTDEDFDTFAGTGFIKRDPFRPDER